MAGNLNVNWIHGSVNCATTFDPAIQVHKFDGHTFILRQSKCSEPGTLADPGPSFEAPFMYLLIGKTRALLLDTGASSTATLFPLAATVNQLLQDHAAAFSAPRVPLLVAHSHSHGDHVAGDAQFQTVPGTMIVTHSLSGVKSFFGFANWPDSMVELNLGQRGLDIVPIPGHEAAHIALYDRNTQLLLTGDSLYPGLLVVNDWNAYIQSIARLKRFCDGRTVSFVLGAHIEMTNQPGRWFGLGALFQPNEHVLELTKTHLVELHDALHAIGSQPRTDRRDDFIIWPEGAPLPALDR